MENNRLFLDKRVPSPLISKLDIKSDTFDTSGLAAAYSKFDNTCK